MRNCYSGAMMVVIPRRHIWGTVVRNSCGCRQTEDQRSTGGIADAMVPAEAPPHPPRISAWNRCRDRAICALFSDLHWANDLGSCCRISSDTPNRLQSPLPNAVGHPWNRETQNQKYTFILIKINWSEKCPCELNLSHFIFRLDCLSLLCDHFCQFLISRNGYNILNLTDTVNH